MEIARLGLILIIIVPCSLASHPQLVVSCYLKGEKKQALIPSHCSFS
jgi:hypothetical protein